MPLTNKKEIFQERKNFILDFLKSLSFGMIFVFIAIGIYVASNVLNTSWTSVVNNKMAEVNQLNGQLTANIAKFQMIDEQKRHSMVGLNAERKVSDDEMLHELIVSNGNWTSQADAADALLDFQNRYGSSHAWISEIFPPQSLSYKDRLYYGWPIETAIQDLTWQGSWVTSTSSDIYTYYILVTGTRQINAISTSVDSFLKCTVTADGIVDNCGVYSIEQRS